MALYGSRLPLGSNKFISFINVLNKNVSLFTSGNIRQWSLKWLQKTRFSKAELIYGYDFKTKSITVKTWSLPRPKKVRQIKFKQNVADSAILIEFAFCICRFERYAMGSPEAWLDFLWHLSLSKDKINNIDNE